MLPSLLKVADIAPVFRSSLHVFISLQSSSSILAVHLRRSQGHPGCWQHQAPGRDARGNHCVLCGGGTSLGHVGRDRCRAMEWIRLHSASCDRLMSACAAFPTTYGQVVESSNALQATLVDAYQVLDSRLVCLQHLLTQRNACASFMYSPSAYRASDVWSQRHVVDTLNCDADLVICMVCST